MSPLLSKLRSTARRVLKVTPPEVLSSFDIAISDWGMIMSVVANAVCFVAFICLDVGYCYVLNQK